LENVLIAAKLAGAYGNEINDRARELLSKMGMGNKERQIPGKLSGGERQRVAIARAMINSPKLILADEPTGNLDERTGGEVMELLLESCGEQKTALVLVTHNQKFAEATDQTLFLKEGKLQN
jgi:ABC-type lipoprotein export system ATPase subunit